ncbi:MAG: hypothetical protein II393_03470, partial [Cytophagales bacterium]|nr:hypothetical protein [Cytophagales bacterium]
ATGEWKTAFEKAMHKKEVEDRYQEIVMEKMKLTVEEYEEEKAQKDKEVNQVIENVRRVIQNGNKKDKKNI